MPSTLTAGALALMIAGGPGATRDFVGMFAAGAPDTTYLSWAYVANDSHVRPVRGKTDATVHLPFPSATGDYEARLLSLGPDGAFHAVLKGVAFHIGAAPPPPVATIASISLSPASVSLNDSTTQGTKISTATVGMSDGSPFKGQLTFSNGTATDGFFQISGLDIVAARNLTSADQGSHSTTVVPKP